MKSKPTSKSRKSLKTIRDMSRIDNGLPVFVVKRGKVVAKYIDKNGAYQETIYLTFKCPKCYRVINHTGDGFVRGNSDGHRHSHCGCWRPCGYNIVEA